MQESPPVYPWRHSKPRSSGSHTETHPKHGTFKIQDFLPFNKKPLYEQKPFCLYKGRGRREVHFLRTEHVYCHAWQSNSLTIQLRWREDPLGWSSYYNGSKAAFTLPSPLAEQNPRVLGERLEWRKTDNKLQSRICPQWAQSVAAVTELAT